MAVNRVSFKKNSHDESLKESAVFEHWLEADDCNSDYDAKVQLRSVVFESCWTKPNNCNARYVTVGCRGHDGPTGRSHPPQCTTSREDRQILRMAVNGSLSHITNRSTGH
ncbi:hypothetical protein TNCV_4266741 [Trichonephila clavipes]|nr:hypothetical protein TNCV_4266741 [Trichonephila clavipes]